MDIYENPDTYQATEKADHSPLTAADMASHRYLVQALSALADAIPVLSEESHYIDYAKRKTWGRYWLVDPLDGTREFLARNDEFTVNIALIESSRPVLGVVYAPALDVIYFAEKMHGAYCNRAGETTRLRCRRIESTLEVVVATSRHHRSPDEARLLEAIEKRIAPVKTLHLGSSLKMGYIAEGRADFYPRFGPTMEWDTAAAQLIVEEAGGHLLNARGEVLLYNQQEELTNPAFFVMGDQPERWLDCL